MSDLPTQKFRNGQNETHIKVSEIPAEVDFDNCETVLMEEKEFILSAAIWINDNQIHEQQPENIKIGFVICGRRHSNCYQTITDLRGDLDKYFKSLNTSLNKLETDYGQPGFITSLDRYVDRKEGWVIAKANNQIQFGLAASENGDDSILISENLY